MVVFLEIDCVVLATGLNDVVWSNVVLLVDGKEINELNNIISSFVFY